MTSVMPAHHIPLARVQTARRTYDLSFPALSYCGCGRSALNEQVFAMPAVRARIADIGELRSGVARWLPPNTLGPNTARRAGHLLAPPGIERDDAAMSSTATGTRSRWFPLPHKPISVGAEALTILLWAACLVSRRGAVDR